MGYEKFKKGLFMGFISLSLVACSGGFDSNIQFENQSFEQGLSLDAEVSEKTKALIEEVNQSQEKVDECYLDVKKQEKKIQTIDILSYLLAIPFKVTDDSAQQKLKNPIKSVLNKVQEPVDRAYILDNDILEKLDLIEQELDARIPSHKKALHKISKIRIKLDDFKYKVDKAVYQLIGVTDKIIMKLNLKISSYLPIDPRAMLVKGGKKYFVDFKEDLRFCLEHNEN